MLSVAHVSMHFHTPDPHTFTDVLLYPCDLFADMKSCGSLFQLPWMSDHVATSELKASAVSGPECE